MSSCEAQPGAGDYAYVDRSFGGAIVYEADGSTQILILMQ